ncbi:MAG: O-antigen ligase family protein [Candidatus Omnitrophica bacterium]|nr:O-antigen ligase family protein [Candidatus Omnitrophota bacterium]
MLNPKGQITTILTFLLLPVVMFFFFIFLPPQLFFVFIFASVIFIIAFINTDFALILLIFSMLLSPEMKSGAIPGRAVVIRIDDIFLFVVFFGWWAKMAMNKELGLLKSTPLNRPILVYIFVCFLATFFGVARGFVNIKYSLFYLLKYIEYFLLYFMVANNIRTLKQAKVYVFFILLTCLLVSIYAWTQIHTGERLSAPFEGEGGEPNTFAGYLLLMMALILGFILYPESVKQRFMLTLFFGFTLIPFILTLSRGGWLAFFPMFLTFIFLNRKYRFPMIVVFLCAIILLPYIFPKKVYTRVKETFAPERSYTVLGKHVNLSESAAARLDTWGIAMRNLSYSPLLGFGIPAASSVDNQFTRVMTETGLIGLMAFLWIIFRIFRVGWGIFRSTKENSFAGGLSLGFLAGFSGIVIMGFTAATFIIIRIMEPFWFLAAIVVSLPQILQKDEK